VKSKRPMSRDSTSLAMKSISRPRILGCATQTCISKAPTMDSAMKELASSKPSVQMSSLSRCKQSHSLSSLRLQQLTHDRGDRVGWGWINETCNLCEHCVSGYMLHCTSPNKKTYVVNNQGQGSFGTGAVWKEQYIFKIPDSLPSDLAAPMMCAGVSVFAPFTLYGLKTTDVVGIVGIGGLGHLAIQFASKMGCEVVAFSASESKKSEALALGAHQFVDTSATAALSLPRKINFLLVTTSQQPNWEQFQPIIAPLATILPLSATRPGTKLVVPYMPFLVQGWRLIGSTVPPKKAYEEMLAFVALHGVKPIIEKFPMTLEGVRESMRRVEEGTMRYRGVLCVEGM
jgi:D-arabinose 1-dehydrogenase-like Zn-dependent alcohol dehydrogenase